MNRSQHHWARRASGAARGKGMLMHGSNGRCLARGHGESQRQFRAAPYCNMLASTMSARCE